MAPPARPTTSDNALARSLQHPQTSIPDSESQIDRSWTVEPQGRRKVKRVTNACVSCRQSKVKCSGLYPCDYCQRRSLECIFADDGRRVTISERYLRHLQKHAKRTPETVNMLQQDHTDTVDIIHDPHDLQQFQPKTTVEIEEEQPGPRSHSSSSVSTEHATTDRDHNSWTSPFTLPSMTMRNNQNTPRGWIFLGPSSTASFTARLTLMISQQLHPQNTSHILLSQDGDVYKLESATVIEYSSTDLKGLPSLEHSLYYFNTVRFHLCQLLRLFDETEFTSHLREFYQDAVQKVAKSRIWFMQYLLVLAFGKALLSQTPLSKTTDPPGADFFTRAMISMPNYTQFWEDPLLAIEVFTLAALYLYSVDRKESAYLYIGHAVRMSLMEGLHTELPKEEIGYKAWKRSYDLWWTVYVLERHFSSSLGVPLSVQDADITTPLLDAKNNSPQDSILTLQVKLSRLLSAILTTLYKSAKGVDRRFLDQTKSVLNTLAELSNELEDIVDTKFKNSVDSPSKGVLHLTLLYHRCVILAMRPLLLSVLAERLEKASQGKKSYRVPSSLMKTLVSTGIQSASKTLHVLSALMESGLLETFLVFDLEYTMGAGTLLALAKSSFPVLIQGRDFSQMALSILSEIEAKGNKVAEARKTELVHLHRSFEELDRREQEIRSGLNESPLASTDHANPVSLVPAATIEPQVSDFPSATGLNSRPVNVGAEFWPQDEFSYAEMSSNERFFANFGISSNNILSVVDQIDYSENFDNGNIPNEWIWASI